MTSPRSAVLFGVTPALALLLCIAAHARAQTAPYNLGTLPSVVVPHWPAAPTITREVQVHTAAEFTQAASVAGTRVVIADVITSGGTIRASDIEVTMLPGASFGGVTIDHACKRIALRGGVYNGTIELAVAASFYPSYVENPAWIISDVMID